MVQGVSKHGSAAVKQYGYNLTRRALAVDFTTGGKGEYLGVGVVDYLKFRMAFSKGRHLNKVLKPRFQYNRLSDR